MREIILRYKYFLVAAVIFLCSLALFLVQLNGIQETLSEEYLEAGYILSNALPSAPPSKFAKLVIIIDDFGEDRAGVREMLSIPAPLTAAVLPFREHSLADATAAIGSGFDVIAHIPFSTPDIPEIWLGKGLIKADMSKQDIVALLNKVKKELPMMKGISNHIGPMGCDNSFINDCLLSWLSEQNMLLVDNMISGTSLSEHSAYQLASLHNMQDFVLERTYFLDGEEHATVDAVKKQIRKAAYEAHETGLSVAVGHVGTEGGLRTAQAISEMLPWLAENNVEIVSIQDLVT